MRLGVITREHRRTVSKWMRLWDTHLYSCYISCVPFLAPLSAGGGGLHYGPFFNTEAGRRERAEPVLRIRLDVLSKRRGRQLAAENLRKRVTAFDLHDTLAELLGTTHGASKYGQYAIPTFGPSHLHTVRNQTVRKSINPEIII